MLHLDEGILSALLDGELSGAEQQEIEAHLRTCAECRDRLAELKGFMQVADQLVTALDEVPAEVMARPLVRRRDYRVLAWAASIVLAVGMGFAGRSLLMDRNALNSANEPGLMSQKTAPVSDAPMPAAAASPETSEAVRARVDARNESSTANKELARDEERRPVRPESAPVDSIGLRSQVSGTMAELPLSGLNDGAAGAGAPTPVPVPDDRLARDTAVTGSQGQLGVGEKDATALRTRARRENAAQAQAASPPAAAMLQPREEVPGFAPLRLTVTRVIPMEEAVRVLGGSIRLVDSLTPARMEIMGADSTIRVVYQTAGVEIWLDQRRVRSAVEAGRSWSQEAESKLSKASNRLSWNDLQGFYLTLTAPLPTAALEQIKARIH